MQPIIDLNYHPKERKPKKPEPEEIAMAVITIGAWIIIGILLGRAL